MIKKKSEMWVVKIYYNIILIHFKDMDNLSRDGVNDKNKAFILICTVSSFFFLKF